MALQLVGFKELLHKMKRVSYDAPVATAFGAYEGLQEIIKDAKERAPKDTKMMAMSGYVTPPSVRDGAAVSMEAGFGGGSEDYVVRVHEDLTMPHPNGGEAKFFSNAMDAGRGNLLDTIKKHVTAYLKTGRTTPAKKVVPASPYEDRP